MKNSDIVKLAVILSVIGVGVMAMKWHKERKEKKKPEKPSGTAYNNLAGGPPTCPVGQVPAWYETRDGKRGWICVPAED